MTDIAEIVAKADPTVDDVPLPSLDAVWRKLDSCGASCRPVRALRAATRRQQALTRVLAVAAAAVIALAGALVVGTSGAGPTSAFAGWNAQPTPLQTGQIDAASAECAGRDPWLSRDSLTVTDARGPFSMLVYAQPAGTTVCITGMPGNEPVVGGGGAANTPAPDLNGISIGGVLGETDANGDGLRFLAAKAGADVTGVTLMLNDGTPVDATIANGWLAAWWPGARTAVTADITTTTGTTTAHLGAAVQPAGTTTP